MLLHYLRADSFLSALSTRRTNHRGALPGMAGAKFSPPPPPAPGLDEVSAIYQETSSEEEGGEPALKSSSAYMSPKLKAEAVSFLRLSVP